VVIVSATPITYQYMHFGQASLKKIMTMLGRVRRRQVDDNPALAQSRPAVSSRSEDFYKAVTVQSQRLRLEYVPHWLDFGRC
jgi:hypothetical protein